ncbi:glutathione S-transferase theta-1-like [Bubalus kerabau]|uniref:glutathione S-transferase theta-1-like n=1 Tax=Bubalus carabanensis TaxID=3119969 RepID=UPI00244EB728|nr:glutathione S-transferase theta-1-like [Bubalus carabanensis]
MDLELFLDLYLPPYNAIYIFTRKNGIPFKLREHLNPEFLKVNPMGKVPALRDGDFLLAKRRRHTSTRQNGKPTPVWVSARPGSTRLPSSLPPTSTLSPAPLLLAAHGDATQVEQLLGKLTPALGHLDQELLAARPFLASGQPSAVGCNLFRDWPKLATWQAHVEAALGPELVQKAHRHVLQSQDPQEAQWDPQMAQKLAQLVKEQLH